MAGRRRIAFMATLLLVASGAESAAAGTRSPPVSGSWKIFNGQGLVSGGFVVTSRHEVRDFTMTFGNGAPDGCSGAVGVLGSLRIRYYSGTLRPPQPPAHYHDWDVGKPYTTTISAFPKPAKATIKTAGQSVAGHVGLAFYNRRGGVNPFTGSDGIVEFEAPGQPECRATFSFKKR